MEAVELRNGEGRSLLLLRDTIMATVATNIVESGFNQVIFNKWQNGFNKSQVCSHTFDASDFDFDAW